MKKICSILISFFIVSCDQKPNNSGANPQGEDKILSVATSADVKPFVYMEENQIVGFDVVMAQHLADAAGISLQLNNITFDEIIDKVANKEYEAGIAAIAITPERRKKVDFTQPYHRSISVIVTPTGSSVYSLKDLEHMAVGVQNGTTYEDFAKKNLKDTYILTRPTYEEILAAMFDNQCDAIITGFTEAKTLLKNDPGLRIIKISGTEVEYAVALPKRSPYLTIMNAKIKRMVKDGTLSDMEKTYLHDILK